MKKKTQTKTHYISVTCFFQTMDDMPIQITNAKTLKTQQHNVIAAEMEILL